MTFRRSSARERRVTCAVAGTLWLSCWLVCACSSSGGTSNATKHDAGGGTSGGAAHDAGAPGSISGMLDGGVYNDIAAAWLIGKPDDPTHTRVIYLFDRAIKCSEITKTAWDQAVADATQSLEIKLIGTKAGRYPIAANGRPATGEAAANYTLTSTTGTPAEQVASAGEIMLDHIEDNASADGTFTITFDGGKFSGKFNAAYCAAGREP